MLGSLDHQVDVVADGVGALDAAASKKYDIILMDIHMPGMDGVEATKRIRALPGRAGKVPIVAMTANALPHQVKAFRDAGMNDYLGKPFAREDLFATLARCVRVDSLVDPATKAADDRVAEVLDREAFNTLVALLGDDKAGSLLGKLRKELEDSFDCRDATEEDDAALARKAHRLVSSAGMLGFLALAQSCANFEAAVQAGRGVPQSLDAVRRAIGLAKAEIAARLSPQDDIKRSA
jgi:CheY-like chemotaxis protein/HPt (histidine-containing phosphotransfer) domain-containing protein